MQRELNIQSVQGRMPVKYSIKTINRILGIIFQAFIIFCCLLVLFTSLKAKSSVWLKIIPLIVLFVALDNLLRHLTSLNCVIFTPEYLWLKYLLLPSVQVPYDSISKLELRKEITYNVFITFTDNKGKTRVLKCPASFPKMIEILYNLAELAPQAQMNDQLDNMVNVIRDIKSKGEKVE
ncbi:MAG: hypothetical protein LHW61_03995 [Candidatus Cloacimonetes bacterium]|nr:hypothetical protein [Candidatus Cloacimonadota bacterium]